MPLEDPPDWLDIGKDVIRQKLCCKETSYPDSYFPEGHPLREGSITEQDIMEKEGRTDGSIF